MSAKAVLNFVLFSNLEYILKKFALLFLVFVITTDIFPQALGDDLRVFGQVRLRSEIDGRDFWNKSYPLTYTFLRARVGVEKSFGSSVKAMVVLQDSRLFGEELGTTNSISNVDLNQAWLQIIDPFELPLSVKAGRMEVTYGTERFFAKNDWSNVSRRFDGVVFSFKPGFKLDLFALTDTDSSGFVRKETPPKYPNAIPDYKGKSVYGFWSQFDISPVRLDLFGYYEYNGKKSNRIDPDMSVITAGMNLSGNVEWLRYLTEAAFQTGKTSVRDVSAYLVSVMAAYSTKPLEIGLQADISSGTAPADQPTKNNTFNASYNSGHKFFGSMDYFTSMSRDTRNLGIHDLFLFGRVNVSEVVQMRAQFHYFSAAQESRLGNKLFGYELDVDFGIKMHKSTEIFTGISAFLPGELMLEFNNNKFDTALWGYLGAVVNF